MAVANAHTTVPLSPDDMQIVFKETDPESKRFIKHIRLTASHPKHGVVGRLEAYKIERTYQLRGHFFEVLDAKSDELADFGTKVIDNDMNVYERLVAHEYHKGTGCWGREMNDGLIMYIRAVNVGAPFERQGVGARLVRELLSSKHVVLGTIVYCWPSVMRAESPEEWRSMNAPIIAFFRKLGFRRVGRTTYFGYSPDSSHPSRLMAASDDLDIDFHKYHYRSNMLDDDLAARLRRDYPLQTLMDPFYSRSEMMSVRCNGAPRPPPPSMARMVAAVRDAYNQDSALIHVRDEQGFTPIYVAASKGYLPVVETLLFFANSRVDILDRDNVRDRNAIEAHEECMRASLLLAKALLPNQCGYLEGDLALQHALRKAAGEDVGAVQDYIAKKRYGCTCGQCLGGWLSPRMAYALHCEGAMIFDLGGFPAMMTFELCPSSDPAHLMMLAGVDCIPPALHHRLNHQFTRGSSGSAVRLSRDRPGRAAHARCHHRRRRRCCSQDWWDTKDVQYYLDAGGKVEYAINYVVDWTKEQMEDETLLDLMIGDERWEAMPCCANDLQFELVGREMGLSATQRWGPYDEDGEPEGVFGGLPGSFARGFYYADSDSSYDEEENEEGNDDDEAAEDEEEAAEEEGSDE
ncbi:hypothetical protein BD626DRAFT_571594 [Schizophyllum amplum]|uniref:N-acetyltransferase domain-containing protein n=1 Tax=Schizophyllum amplum TaxID=97359 RepID=A0A550C6V5_9AGAR|nr:hypothetical protein BD626DRAFT_571594 [Auriculariopsis ampla]